MECSFLISHKGILPVARYRNKDCFYRRRFRAFFISLPRHRLPALRPEAEICLTIITKVIVAASAAVILTASGVAATGDWIKVSDPCNNCKITKYEYTCGKCGSGMKSSFKWDNKQEYLIYTFTCKDRKKKNCTHSCQFKCKP